VVNKIAVDADLGGRHADIRVSLRNAEGFRGDLVAAEYDKRIKKRKCPRCASTQSSGRLLQVKTSKSWADRSCILEDYKQWIPDKRNDP
jgi:hypothetical protein